MGHESIVEYHSVTSCLGHGAVGDKKEGPGVSNFWRSDENDCGG